MATVSRKHGHHHYSTLYSNKLIDLAISVDADVLAGHKDQEEDEDEESPLLSTPDLQQEESHEEMERHEPINNIHPTKLLTVFSTPCPNRSNNVRDRERDSEDELPEYVRNMMEKDVALRRLVKTGSVTISKVKEEEKDEEEEGDDEADEETIEAGQLDEWTGYPAARKLLEFVHLSLKPNPPSPKPLNAESKGNLLKAFSKTLPVTNNIPPPLAPIGIGKKKRSRKHDEETEVLHVDPLKFLEVSLKEGKIPPDDSHRRKYSCKFCEKKFCWSTDLKRHTLIHTGERPFKCTFCPANFTRKFLMQKHLKKIHSHSSNSIKTDGITTFHSKENYDDDFYSVATIVENGQDETDSKNYVQGKEEVKDETEELDSEFEMDELEIMEEYEEITPPPNPMLLSSSHSQHSGVRYIDF